MKKEGEWKGKERKFKKTKQKIGEKIRLLR
jgi:hypothetical protein